MQNKRKLTTQEKEQIYAYTTQGMSVGEIADLMKIDNPQQVAGVVRSGINFDKIPGRKTHKSETAAVPPVLAPVQMAGGAATLEAPPQPVAPAPAPMLSSPEPIQPQPPAQPVSRPVHVARVERAPEAPVDNFSGGWSPVGSFTGGFNNPALNVRYVIYRDEPADGLLGERPAPFSETDLGRLYGRGVYRVQRFDPNNPRPYQTQVRISEAMGEPRFPRREGSSAPSSRPNWGRFGRPWGRPAEHSASEEETRPMERPSMFDYARHAPASDAAVEAIKAMGQMNVKSLELQEAQRRQGPDSYLAKFFQEQQERERQSQEDRRRQDDQRRRDEEEKWERRQKEAEIEHRRRQEEEEKRHDRELAKIKAESEARAKEAEAVRKQLMDIEAQKLKVIEEQNRARQEALQEELKRNRELQKERDAQLTVQLKEMQASTQAQLQESAERMEKELQREREQLEREHKLREKALDKERELENKVLDIKSSQLEAQGSSEIVGVVNNVINKFSSAVAQIVDLKKLEAAASPETQAAIVMKGQTDAANAKHEAAVPKGPANASGAPTSPAAAPVDGAKDGGQPTAAQGETQEVSMKSMIRDQVDKPFFKEVLEEWAMHVKTEQDGTTFLNMYREWMCDPNDHEGRKATTMFANFIAPRSWEDFYGLIKDKLDPKVVKVFDLPHAKVFYETFRSLLVEQIRAFWEQFGQEREAVNAGRRAAGTEVPAK